MPRNSYLTLVSSGVRTHFQVLHQLGCFCVCGVPAASVADFDFFIPFFWVSVAEGTGGRGGVVGGVVVDVVVDNVGDGIGTAGGGGSVLCGKRDDFGVRDLAVPEIVNLGLSFLAGVFAVADAVGVDGFFSTGDAGGVEGGVEEERKEMDMGEGEGEGGREGEEEGGGVAVNAGADVVCVSVTVVGGSVGTFCFAILDVEERDGREEEEGGRAGVCTAGGGARGLEGEGTCAGMEGACTGTGDEGRCAHCGK